MDRVVSATQARIHFGQLLRQARAGEVVLVEHAGKPAVVILAVEEYLKLKARQQQDWRQTLEKIVRLNAQRQASGCDLTAPTEILRELREERDDQLQRLR